MAKEKANTDDVAEWLTKKLSDLRKCQIKQGCKAYLLSRMETRRLPLPNTETAKQVLPHLQKRYAKWNDLTLEVFSTFKYYGVKQFVQTVKN